MKNIIPKSVFEINKIFKDNNFELFVVGGAVRDYVMGITPKDFDLSTNATSDDIIRILDGRYKYDLHGKDFFVVVVYTEDTPLGFEIATFRSDVYDGKLGITRNPNVIFSDIDGDCERRDLTFNSMYYNIEKDLIIDKMGGQNDIKNKICRFVGDPLQRIKEDPQRIVRIIRFASRFSFEIEPHILEIIKDNVDKLDIITRDRITKEFVAMFSYGDEFGYSYGMVLMHQCGILKYLFKPYNIDETVIHDKYMEVHFAYMLRNIDDGTLFKHMVDELKFKKTFVRKALFLKRLMEFDINDVLNLYKKKRADDVSSDMVANFISHIDVHNKELYSFLEFSPTINSKDLMEKGYFGVELGIEQQRLESEKFRDIINDYEIR